MDYSSTEGLKVDDMSDVGRVVSCLGNDLIPSVGVNVTDVVNSSGWMDTQVFVYVDDVDVETETLMFEGSMKAKVGTT